MLTQNPRGPYTITGRILLHALIIFSLVGVPLFALPMAAQAQPLTQNAEPAPLTGLIIDGPAVATAGVKIGLRAAPLPKGATTPITYDWSPRPHVGQGSAAASYLLSTPGKQTIKVTATGADGKEQSATHVVEVKAATPRQALATTLAPAMSSMTVTVGMDVTFQLTVDPADATGYRVIWSPTPLRGQGTPQATFRWLEAGQQTVQTVLINADDSMVTATATVDVQPAAVADLDFELFVPLLANDNAAFARGAAVEIVGGREAEEGEWPWQVALMFPPLIEYYFGVGQFCGGTLIAPDWVLTAAHCVEELTRFDLYIVTGRHRLSSDQGQELSVAQIIIHEDYAYATSDSDIALIQLSAPSTAQPVNLDPPPFTPGQLATAIGWGNTENGNPYSASDVLMEVDVPIVSQDACRDAYGDELTDTMLCAGDEGMDSCQGDSGGPLMIPIDADSGQWGQIGIVSWGNGCGLGGYPGVYTNLQLFRDWIAEIIDEGDEYEPDNNAARASAITAGADPQLHTLHRAGDSDWVTFMPPVQGVGPYVLETFNLAPNTDTVVTFFDQEGNELGRDDDGGGGYASRLQAPFPQDGPIFARVQAYDPAAGSDDHAYALRLTLENSVGINGDAYETDDSAAQAQLITVDGETQFHNFHQVGDVDWLRFDAVADQFYSIQISDLSPRADTVLTLYDESGRELAYNDDVDGDPASRIIWSAPASGSYLVRIRDYNPQATLTSYNVAVATMDAPVFAQDSHEPDDSREDAGLLVVNAVPQVHTFHQRGDADWLRLEAEAGQLYTVETGQLTGNADTVLELVDAAGTVLARNNDSGAALASRLDWSAPADATYFVRITNDAPDHVTDSTGYVVVARSMDQPAGDVFEADDSMAQAVQIDAILGTQSHTLHQPGDQDWIRFRVGRGLHYVISTSEPALHVDTVLELYDDGGYLLSSNDDGPSGSGSQLAWQATYNGDLFARIRHVNPSIGGPGFEYTINVALASATPSRCEPNEEMDSACAVTADGRIYQEAFFAAGDRDWFTFPVVKDALYRMDTLNLGSSSDPVLTLVDAAGVVLATDDDSGGGLAAAIEWTATADGTLYLLSSPVNAAQTGYATRYDLRISATGAPAPGDSNEPNDSPEQAKRIAANGPAQTQTFHQAGDEDWFVFTALEGYRYQLETFNLRSNADTVISLLDGNGSLLTGDDNSGVGNGSLFTYQIINYGGEELYLRIENKDPAVYGAQVRYDFNLTATPPPPPGQLANGGFEDGPVDWVESSNYGYPLIVGPTTSLQPPFAPHGGDWVAWLGGLDYETSILGQEVTISAEAPYLTYWHYIASSDACGYDYGGVGIDGTWLYVYDLCYETQSNGWEFVSVDMSALAGQRIVLDLVTITDSSLSSSLFFDDVAFVTAAQAATLAARAAEQTGPPASPLMGKRGEPETGDATKAPAPADRAIPQTYR